MHAISSYRVNRHRPPATNTQTRRQDRLQYTAPLASAQCNKGFRLDLVLAVAGLDTGLGIALGLRNVFVFHHQKLIRALVSHTSYTSHTANEGLHRTSVSFVNVCSAAFCCQPDGKQPAHHRSALFLSQVAKPRFDNTCTNNEIFPFTNGCAWNSFD